MVNRKKDCLEEPRRKMGLFFYLEMFKIFHGAKIAILYKIMEHQTILPEDMVQAGTGEMYGLADAIDNLKKMGYIFNLIPRYDHFTTSSGKFKLYPKDIFFDEVLRFENTSDPDDQAILYAISSQVDAVKGLYVESYGLYHDELSPTIIRRIQECHALRQNAPHRSGTGVAF